MKKLYGKLPLSLILFISFFSPNLHTQDVNVAPGTKLTVADGTTLKITNGNLVLHDDQSTSPSLLDRGTISITGGEAQVEQYITRDVWHKVGVPLNGATASVYMWMYLKEYLEPNGYSYITSPTDPLSMGNGYFVYSYTVDAGIISYTSIGWRGTDAGGNLKEVGLTHWASPNTGATNSCGFTTISVGTRAIDGTFYGHSIWAHFWSSNDNSSYA